MIWQYPCEMRVYVLFIYKRHSVSCVSLANAQYYWTYNYTFKYTFLTWYWIVRSLPLRVLGYPVIGTVHGRNKPVLSTAVLTSDVTTTRAHKHAHTHARTHARTHTHTHTHTHQKQQFVLGYLPTLQHCITFYNPLSCLCIFLGR